jgi:hypothetical protein
MSYVFDLFVALLAPGARPGGVERELEIHLGVEVTANDLPVVQWSLKR